LENQVAEQKSTIKRVLIKSREGEDYRVLAWWISASRALRDPLRDKGLLPWNMTSQEVKSVSFSRTPNLKNTEAWARNRGAPRRRPTRNEREEGKLFWFGFVGK
jgi:hypothetical protein